MTLRSASGRRVALLSLVPLVTVLGLVAGGCGAGSSHPTAAPPSSSPTGTSGPGSFQPSDDDLSAVRHVLATRASAALHHDEAAFLATVDDHDPELVARQRTLYANLAQLPLASLTYQADTSSLLVPADLDGDDPTVRPFVVEQLRLRGTSPAPITNAVNETFVRRDGHWLVGDESEPSDSSSGDTSQERPWYGAPIVARQDGPLTVLVDRSRASTLAALTHQVADDIDADASLLGVPSRHDILVDATSNGASTSFSTLSKEQAGAVTFQLAHTNPSGDTYLRSAGQAIKINPHEVGRLAASTPLLRHELTHFLLFEYVPSSPKWLSEGVATWVQYYPDDYSRLQLRPDFYRKVTHADHELPAVGVFNYDPDVHYLIAQSAVAWLVSHYGIDRLLALMRAYRTGYQDANVDALTPRLLRKVYGVSEQQVVDGAFGLIATFQH